MEEDVGKVGFVVIDMFLFEIIGVYVIIKDFVGLIDNLGDVFLNLINLFFGCIKDLSFDLNYFIICFMKVCVVGYLFIVKWIFG